MSTRFEVRRWLILSGALVVTAGLYAALPGDKLGSAETRANTTVTLAQQSAAVARDADGDYVVVWTSATATDAGEIYFQRYNANGVAQGDETVVNTTAAGAQIAPAVAMDASGNFVVAWSGNGTQTDQVDTAGVFIQRFDAQGAPLGEETRVNTATANTQELAAVAMDADGDFVVVWQSLAQDGSGQGVYGQRYDSAGAAQGAEFQVNSFTTGSQRDASVAMALDGGFVVVWESNSQDGDLNGIYGRAYAADGTDVRAEFAVNVTTAGSQDDPVVGRSAGGEFVVAWTSADADGTGIYARRFDSGANPVDSSEFEVNTSPAGTQAAAAVAVDANGAFAIAWESNHTLTNGYDIIVQRYEADGVAGSEGEVTANSTAASDQRAASIAVDVDGDIVVAWGGNGTGDTSGVFSRRLAGPEAVDLAITKTDSPDPVSTGQTLTYTISVENLHPAATTTGDAALDAAIGSAAGVVVTDTLPTGNGDNVTFLDAQGEGWTCTNTANTSVTCSLDGVLPADTAASPIEISVLAPAVAPADRSVSNTATVASSQYDAVAANNSDSDDTVVCGVGESPGTLAVSNTSALESVNGPLSVTRSGGTCGAVSVQVAIANGTAVAPGDYAAMAPQTLTWANGETGAKNAAANVQVVDDSVYEANETVTVTLGNAVRAALGANGTFTINDNDPAPTLSIADSSVAEGNTGTALLPFTVTLTPAPGTTIGRSVTVEYDTANGTATTADGDYVAVTDGLLTFNVGDATKTLNVTVNGDVKDEDDETLVVTLSNEVPAAVNISDATATGTITSDDDVPTVAFALATSSVSEAPTNPPFNDEAPTLDVQVSLSTASSRTVSVKLSHAGSTASLPGDYTASPLSTVTFAPGETSKTVTLTVALDTLDENDETVQLTLNDPTNATIGAQATHVATILDDDALPVLTTSGPASVSENAGPATITVTLSPASGRDVSVNYALGGTATAGGTDYAVSPAPGTLSFAAGEVSKTLTVTLNNDALDENNETVVATLSAPQNASLGSPSAHTLTINDEDATPTVTFSAAAQDVDEDVAGGTATATLNLSAASGRTITVPFTVNAAPAQGGDAASGADFSVPTASPITIPAGTTSATITISIVNDGSNEPNENVRLALGTPTNATVGATPTHVATIVNDDAQPQVSFAAAAQSKGEGAGAVAVTLQLSRAAEQDITVSYAVSGTASGGDDFTIAPASPLIIAEGESGGVITVTLSDDARVEASETVVLSLTGAVNGEVVDAAKTHTLTVTNNDTAGVVATQSGGATNVTEGGAGDSYTLVLTSEPASSVTISPTSSGQTTVTASVTFTPDGATAWNIPQTVTVDAVDDMAGEGNHGDTITHTVSSADLDYDGVAVADVGVAITDNDVPAIVITQGGGGTTVTEGGATDSYDVVLSAQPAQDVTVNLSHDAQVSLSTSSLTFTTANWNQAQSVTVTAVNDDVAEGTHTSVVMHASASADGGFDGLTADVTAQITDDDSAGVVLSKVSATATEGGAGDSYTVRLNSQPVGDVVVSLMPDAQVSIDVTEIVFNAVNWNLAVTVNVTAVNDALDEVSPHNGVVTHAVSATASDANYDGLAVSDVTVAVTDDDAPPAVTLSLADSPLAEDGGVATVTAMLSAPSAQNVTVNLAYGGTATPTADYAASAASISIPAGSLSGSVTITGVNDALDEADETVSVDIASVSNGTESGTQQVIATIVDDDAAPGVSLSLAGSPLAENGGVATVTATLSSPSSQNVTVNLAYAGTASGSDYTASSASIVIPAGNTTGTATLTGVNDALDEAVETVTVDIASVTNATETGTQQVIASITDDDAAPGVSLSLAGSPLAENGGVATVTATLSAVSGQSVTVNLAYAGTASGSDYTASSASIVIPAGSTSGAATLTGVNDALDEADETVTADITTVTNGTETGAQQVIATITDDDAAPTVTLGASAASMPETGGTATLTATLSAASGRDVTVSLGFGGTAANPADYTASASSITILAGSLSGTVTLTAAPDAVDEANETIIADITSVTNGTESGTQTQTVSITDDDAAPSGGGGGGGGSWSLLGLWMLLPALVRRRRVAAG